MKLPERSTGSKLGACVEPVPGDVTALVTTAAKNKLAGLPYTDGMDSGDEKTLINLAKRDSGVIEWIDSLASEMVKGASDTTPKPPMANRTASPPPAEGVRVKPVNLSIDGGAKKALAIAAGNNMQMEAGLAVLKRLSQDSKLISIVGASFLKSGEDLGNMDPARRSEIMLAAVAKLQALPEMLQQLEEANVVLGNATSLALVSEKMQIDVPKAIAFVDRLGELVPELKKRDDMMFDFERNRGYNRIMGAYSKVAGVLGGTVSMIVNVPTVVYVAVSEQLKFVADKAPVAVMGGLAGVAVAVVGDLGIVSGAVVAVEAGHLLTGAVAGSVVSSLLIPAIQAGLRNMERSNRSKDFRNQNNRRPPTTD